VFASPEDPSLYRDWKHEPLSEANCLLAEIGAYLDEMPTAGGERALVLSTQAQERLYAEILKACELTSPGTRIQ
jgi:hypothetical protein